MPDPIPQPRYAFVIGDRSRSSQRAGLALAIVLHLVLLALLIRPIHREIKALFEVGSLAANRGGGGGGGGGRMAYISLPAPSASAPVTVSPPQAPAVAPPVVAAPTPTPPPVIPPPEPVTAPETAVASAIASGTDSLKGSGAGTGGGTGGGAGGGNGPGSGPGSGPGNGGGEGSLARGPRPRSEMWPSLDEFPKELRGRPIHIVFDVRADGRVDGVRFEPEIKGKFGDRLRETMKNYRFRPALDAAGRPVDGTYPYTMSF